MGTDLRVLVAIPWRPQPSRMDAHEATVARYRELLPGAEIVDVDTNHEPFCLAACRNEGVRLAEESGADVVVLADADTLPEREPLLAAIEGAAVNGKVNLPYSVYRSLRGAGTRAHLAGKPLPDCDHIAIPSACSGVLVTTPATWWACGGQDERCLGWGMEDVCFLVAHRALLGEMVRHKGRVYALGHESAAKKGPHYDANVALLGRYIEAAERGGVDAVRALIAERSGVEAGAG